MVRFSSLTNLIANAVLHLYIKLPFIGQSFNPPYGVFEKWNILK